MFLLTWVAIHDFDVIQSNVTLPAKKSRSVRRTENDSRLVRNKTAEGRVGNEPLISLIATHRPDDFLAHTRIFRLNDDLQSPNRHSVHVIGKRDGARFAGDLEVRTIQIGNIATSGGNARFNKDIKSSRRSERVIDTRSRIERRRAAAVTRPFQIIVLVVGPLAQIRFESARLIG